MMGQSINRIRSALSRFLAIVAEAFSREQGPQDSKLVSRQFTLWLVWASLIALAVITLSGYLTVRSQLTQAREEAYKDLEAIAILKAEQVKRWQEERFIEAHFLSRVPALGRAVKRMLDQPDDPEARETVLGWLANIKAGNRYRAVMVYDAQGTLRYAIPDIEAEPHSHMQSWVSRALANPEVQQVDLHQDKSTGETHLSLSVPLLQQAGAGEDTRPIGLILLMLDPANYLYPLIQSWPVPSASGESLLVRREGNEVVFLNELRHQKGAAFKLRFPIDDPMLPEARALRGETGLFTGRDYRGVEVLSTSLPIAGSPWVLIAKVDAKEIFGSIRRQAVEKSLLFGLLIIVVIFAAMFLYRYRVHQGLRLKMQAEKERNELASRFLLLTEHANDMILLLDQKGSIKEANQRAVSTYGYTLEELQQLPPGGLRTVDSSQNLDTQFQQFSSAQGAVIETLHQRKDGSTFPVEISGRSVTGANDSILMIMRDITQRKAHEAVIEQLNRLHTVLSQVNQAIVQAVDRESLMQAVCLILTEEGGFAMAWIGSVDPVTRQVLPVARHGDHTGYLDTVIVRSDASPEGLGPAGMAIRENCPQIFSGFQTDPRTQPWHEAARQAGFNSVAAIPVPRPDAPFDVILVYSVEHQPFSEKEINLLQEAANDLSFGLQNLERDAQRRQAEEALQKSEAFTTSVLDSLTEHIAVLDPTGTIIAVNRAWREFALANAGSPELVSSVGLNYLEVCQEGQETPVEGNPHFISDGIRDVLKGDRVEFVQEYPCHVPNGERRWFVLRVTALQGSDRGAVVAHETITDRKLIELALEKSLHEKEALLKEVHHRVKNNLQVITSLLRLEAARSQGPDTKEALGEMQSRIRSMALLHETLYRSGNFARVDLRDYLHNLATQLFRAQNIAPERVGLDMALVSVAIEIDQAIPCGLIVNELLTNALKYAFPDDRSGEIRLITQVAKDGQVSLVISDDGVGLPANLEVESLNSLGLQLVSDLTRQLQGTLKIGPDATFTITFAHRRNTATPFPS